MEQMNSLYNITKQILVTLNQQCSTIDERTTMIDKVNELLEQRGKILETLTPPYSKKETTTGVKIINMDNMIKERMDCVYGTIRDDLKQLKYKKDSDLTYINPYKNMKTVDGMYVDNKL